MARPLRREFSGALYQVTARGDGREDICLSDDDRRLFLEVLGWAKLTAESDHAQIFRFGVHP